jgi:hypothetical protein
LDEAINEMGTVAAPHVEDNNEQCRTVEKQVSKKLEDLLNISLMYMGYPQVGKGKVSLG